VRHALVLALLTLFPLACGDTHGGAYATVAHVLDGDTIVLEDGRHVRLVQLDAPETDEGECYARKAERALRDLLPPGTGVEIETDPALDKRDRFGRTLAYVRKDGANINLELVRMGAAAPWFFHGDRGRYASSFLAAARDAEKARRGLWGACPGTALNPQNALEAQR
jgi:endonuclease YncB( thermonuclease family)